MKLLREFNPLDYDRETIERSKSENGGRLVLKGILQKADTLNQNGRIYPRAILEREVMNYQKFINERRSLGECVPPGTEIFTSEGWKKIEAIADDEVIATMNIETNELEYQQINHKIDIPYSGKLYRFKNHTTYDMCLTADHNVLMWDRKGQPFKMRADELYEIYSSDDVSARSMISHSGFKRAGTKWIGENPDNVTIAGKDVDARLWASFLGIYLAEGCASGVYKEHCRKDHTVGLCQNEGERADAIRDMLQQLPWDFSERFSKREGGKTRYDWSCKDEALHAELLPLGGSREKHVPDYVKTWSPMLLEVLLKWMLMGDGLNRKGGYADEYATTSKRLTDDVYDIMLKLGEGASVRVRKPKDRPSPDFGRTGRMILAENQADMNIVYRHLSAGMSADLRFMKAYEYDYEGRVYCVNVDNGTWLMRYNNKTCWTSNCDHPESSVVELKNVSHLVTKMEMDDDGIVHGEVEVLDTPCGEILLKLVEAGVKLGISSRGVGSTVKDGDADVVQDDFSLICLDFVSEPSTPGAFLSEGKNISLNELRQTLNKSDRVFRAANEVLRLK